MKNNGLLNTQLSLFVIYPLTNSFYIVCRLYIYTYTRIYTIVYCLYVLLFICLLITFFFYK